MLGGKAGAGSSCSGLLSLLGGVLNGDDLSIEVWFWTGAARFLLSMFIAKFTGLLPILGFSARLTGGGPAFGGASRLCSPDLLGGGGDGGWDGGREGDLPGSRRGVCGLLGILKCLGEEDPEAADSGASVDKYEEAFARVKFRTLFLGGDCGG